MNELNDQLEKSAKCSAVIMCSLDKVVTTIDLSGWRRGLRNSLAIVALGCGVNALAQVPTNGAPPVIWKDIMPAQQSPGWGTHYTWNGVDAYVTAPEPSQSV